MSWSARITAAVKRKNKFTTIDKDQAGAWEHCAVGEGLEALGIPDWERQEEDIKQYYPVLDKLGREFYNAVDDDKPGLARKLYTKIGAIISALRRPT